MSPVLVAVAAVLLALPAAAFLLVKAVHLAATRRPGMSRGAVGPWVEGAVACLSVAVVAFALGSLSGFDSRPVRPCIAERAERFGPQSDRTPDDDIKITSRVFPVSRACAFPDGVDVELVPVWVNPLQVVAPAGAVACGVRAVRARSSSRCSRTAGQRA
ncbi:MULTISPECIES: hypothetical protein [unclassified Streptomyces]|uniref:hypothetical protein n=1 Tax=unclassified Streptomyces TaxID=2593676 RepID=UPI0004BDB6EA|nr:MULTISPECIES: hypothetical protein [unclassified Streptomyces]